MAGLVASHGERYKSQLDVTKSSGDILVTFWAGIGHQECAFRRTGHLRKMDCGGVCVCVCVRNRDYALTIQLMQSNYSCRGSPACRAWGEHCSSPIKLPRLFFKAVEFLRPCILGTQRHDGNAQSLFSWGRESLKASARARIFFTQ